MDLSTLDTKSAANAGSWLHLRSPKGGALLYADEEKTLPMRIKLLGADSDEYQRLVRGLSDEQRAAARKGLEVESTEALEGEAIKIIVGVSVECENLVLKGDEVESTKLAFRALYVQFPWIAEQAGGHIRNRGAYLENA